MFYDCSSFIIYCFQPVFFLSLQFCWTAVTAPNALLITTAGHALVISKWVKMHLFGCRGCAWSEVTGSRAAEAWRSNECSEARFPYVQLWNVASGADSPVSNSVCYRTESWYIHVAVARNMFCIHSLESWCGLIHAYRICTIDLDTIAGGDCIPRSQDPSHFSHFWISGFVAFQFHQSRCYGITKNG